MLGQILKQISNAFQSAGNQVLQRYDLTVTQMNILRYVNEQTQSGHSVNQHSIEEAMKLKNPTVTGILNRLEGKGFIHRVEDECDRRRKLIKLGEREMAFRGDVTAAFRAVDELITRDFTAEEKQTLLTLLSRALDNITEDGGRA